MASCERNEANWIQFVIQLSLSFEHFKEIAWVNYYSDFWGNVSMGISAMNCGVVFGSKMFADDT